MNSAYVPSNDPELAGYLWIEERELEADGLELARKGLGIFCPAPNVVS